jgi:hypothetical protein
MVDPEGFLCLVVVVQVVLMAVRLVMRLGLVMVVAVAVLEQTVLILLWLVAVAVVTAKKHTHHLVQHIRTPLAQVVLVELVVAQAVELAVLEPQV